MKTYETFSDVAAIRIFTNDVSFYFNNGIGDGSNTVHICENKTEAVMNLEIESMKFQGTFDVYISNTVSLSEYDCNRTPVHCFSKPGRYWVYKTKNEPVFCIYWLDDYIK